MIGRLNGYLSCSRLFLVGLDVLRLRLADGRDPSEKRLDAAAAELAALSLGTYEGLIDYRTVNQEGEAGTVASAIYQAYVQAIGF